MNYEVFGGYPSFSDKSIYGFKLVKMLELAGLNANRAAEAS
jgi:hypothetical protein